MNWCPALGTVLANEEVISGVSERGGHPVVRIPLRQWMLRITAYADRLENDLELVNWPHSIKKLQSDWIGRSTGTESIFTSAQPMRGSRSDTAQIGFRCLGEHRKRSGFPPTPDEGVLYIYTTRPDTLFGATYMVIVPEHPFVARLSTPPQADAVRAYCEAATRKSDLDRTELSKEKTGVFTGSYAINPVNGQAVPIWVADYVLISYGTGTDYGSAGTRRARFRICQGVQAADHSSCEIGHQNVVPDGSDMTEALVADGEASIPENTTIFQRRNSNCESLPIWRMPG